MIEEEKYQETVPLIVSRMLLESRSTVRIISINVKLSNVPFTFRLFYNFVCFVEQNHVFLKRIIVSRTVLYIYGTDVATQHQKCSKKLGQNSFSAFLF